MKGFYFSLDKTREIGCWCKFPVQKNLKKISSSSVITFFIFIPDFLQRPINYLYMVILIQSYEKMLLQFGDI